METEDNKSDINTLPTYARLVNTGKVNEIVKQKKKHNIDMTSRSPRNFSLSSQQWCYP